MDDAKLEVWAVWRDYIESGNHMLLTLYSTEEKAQLIADALNAERVNCHHVIEKFEIDSEKYEMYVH